MDKNNDKAGRPLIIGGKVGSENFLLLNLDDVNTESEQFSTLSDLSNMLCWKKLMILLIKTLYLEVISICVLKAKLEVRVLNPVFKKKIFSENNTN